MFNIKKIEEYLVRPSISETTFINDEETLLFHWANHKFTKKMVKQNILDDFYFIDSVFYIESDESMIRLTKRDILRFIVTKSTNLTELLFEPKKIHRDSISLNPEELELIDLVTKEEIQYAYLSMLLVNKAPQRGLRLNSNQEVLVCFSQNFLKETKVIIHQFSHTGILFKSTGGDFLEHFEDNDNFKFYINSKNFINGMKAYTETESNSFVVNKSSFKFSHQLLTNNSECYFFIRYSDISNKAIKDNFSSCLTSFEANFIKKSA